jgi:hypothetical protein
MPDLIIGGVPRGEDYYGREALIDTLWDRLANDNLLLAAPRRFGKTGAMFCMLDQPRSRYQPLYIDVESIQSAADFMVELVAALIRDRHFSRLLDTLKQGTKELGKLISSLPASIDIGTIKVELREKTDVPDNWASYGERLVGLLARNDPPLLLLIDEFAIMISTIASRSHDEAVHFLRWFRTARIAPDTKTRFVLGSSINLIATLDAMGLVDTVNDLSIIKLQPFDRSTAESFIAAVFEQHKISADAEVITEILTQVGEPIPYFLSVLLRAILDRMRGSDGPVTPEIASAAFAEDLLGGATSAVLQHYRSRIGQYYTDMEGRAARAILGLLSRTNTPVEASTVYQSFLKATNLEATSENRERFLELMSKLENDFYVVSINGGYTFFSRVLRLWWRNNYGFQVE